MANEILMVPPGSQTPPTQYKLHESTRQAILAASPNAKRAQKIERQRLAFISMDGCAFGQNTNTQH